MHYVGAFLVAKKITHAVQETKIPRIECPDGAVTISLGVSTCILTSDKSPKDLIGAADKALYVPKDDR